MQMPFDTYFQSLKGKNILVMGLGVSNRPLVRLLLSYGCTVTGCDRTPREKLDVLSVLHRCRLHLVDGLLVNWMSILPLQGLQKLVFCWLL